jgi:hypothetical protein
MVQKKLRWVGGAGEQVGLEVAARPERSSGKPAESAYGAEKAEVFWGQERCAIFIGRQDAGAPKWSA